MFTLAQLGQLGGQAIDPTNNAFFGTEQSNGFGNPNNTRSLGNADGSGYYSGLLSIPGASSYLAPQGESTNYGAIDPQALQAYLNQNNYSLMEAPYSEGVMRWLQTPDALVGTPEYVSYEDDNFGIASALATAAIGGSVAGWAGAGGATGSGASSGGSMFGSGTVGSGLKAGGTAGLGGTGAGLSASLPTATSLATTGLGSTGGWLSGMGGAALKNAGYNAGFTALQGGDGKDILKSAAIGGLSGGAGYYAGNNLGLSGLSGRAAEAATRGAVGSALYGGSGSDVLRSAAAGGLSQGIPNVAGYLGVPDEYGNTLNSALRGGVSSSLAGGNFLEGAARSSLPTALTDFFRSQTSNMIPDDLPGTLGGTVTDAEGETSVTMGGEPVDTGDTGGNMFATNSSGGNDNPLFSSIQSALGSFSSNPQQIGNFAEGLAGLYQGYKQRKMAKEFMRGYGTNRGSYEKQLRNNLARKDAAMGRRSDYGGRETQLQAALAELDSRNAPAMMQAQNAMLGGNLGMLQSLLRFGGKQGYFGGRQQTPQAQMPSLASLQMQQPMMSDPYSLYDPQRRNPFGGS